jgi:hypothetical protein
VQRFQRERAEVQVRLDIYDHESCKKSIRNSAYRRRPTQRQMSLRQPRRHEPVAEVGAFLGGFALMKSAFTPT